MKHLVFGETILLVRCFAELRTFKKYCITWRVFFLFLKPPSSESLELTIAIIDKLILYFILLL